METLLLVCWGVVALNVMSSVHLKLRDILKSSPLPQAPKRSGQVLAVPDADMTAQLVQPDTPSNSSRPYNSTCGLRQYMREEKRQRRPGQAPKGVTPSSHC